MNNNENQKEYAVEMHHVSKIYRLKKAGKESRPDDRYYALRNLSLKVEKGDVVGILGTNGSGKSTMALVLAGIADCDEGSLTVNGEQALISINTGLNAQLTGEENINVKGALLGLSKKRIDEIKEEVIEFAELGDFLYQPVKKYSSGMKSRLGFSISLALDPDIFIVDEALSVGDKGFANKCLERMEQLRDEKNKTIFFISHSLQQVSEFCKTGLWLDAGELMEFGDIDEVCEHYSDYIDRYNGLKNADKKKERDEKFAKRLIHVEKLTLWERIKRVVKG